MGVLDIIIFVAFIVAVIGVGLWKSKGTGKDSGSGDGAADYFLAGRGLSWWLIGVSLIAANISAEQFVGMSGQAASYLGIAIASYEWLAAITLIIVGFALLPYFLKTGIYTIPGFLEQRYNSLARTIMAIFMMIILIGVSLCGVIYAGALPMRDLLAMADINISLPACCWIMGLLAAAYVAAGGLKACAWADLIQGTALIIGGLLIAIFAFQALGIADISDLVAGVGATTTTQASAAELVKPEMSCFQRFFALNSDKLHMFLPSTDLIIPWTAICLGIWIPNIYYWGLNQYITQRILGSASLSQGQKGIVFAAALKLIIPFIIVFPGIIAFNLYDKPMADKAVVDYVEAQEKGIQKDLGYKLLSPSDAWKKANPTKVQIVDKYNEATKAKIAKANAANKDGKKIVAKTAYKEDSALGLLIGKLCMGKKGLFGFIIAALLGAIVSSLAAVLNAASTIFSIDIYHSYINKKASAKQLVSVGRICVGIFVVIGCVVAPLLDNPKFGGIFTYIQEFQGYVSPGVVAVFIFGLLNRTAKGWIGAMGLLINPVLYFLFAKLFPQMDFLNRMVACLVVVLVLMTVCGFFSKLPKPVEFESKTKIDLTASKSAKIGGIVVVLATIILYIIFR